MAGVVLSTSHCELEPCLVGDWERGRIAGCLGVGITTGWGETEVFMEVSSRRLAIVQHRHPPARGLLSLISLLRAFPLTGINRNQSFCDVVEVRLAFHPTTLPVPSFVAGL